MAHWENVKLVAQLAGSVCVCMWEGGGSLGVGVVPETMEEHFEIHSWFESTERAGDGMEWEGGGGDKGCGVSRES